MGTSITSTPSPIPFQSQPKLTPDQAGTLRTAGGLFAYGSNLTNLNLIGVDTAGPGLCKGDASCIDGAYYERNAAIKISRAKLDGLW